MSEPVVVITEHEQVLTITLNRPEARNAMNRALLDELLAVLDDIAVRREVRAVIFHGAGDKAFSAGADLKERAGLS
ncbi:MAG: enoyl-CoA hydratase-related protein, partial [Myxococcota bacterium]